MRGKATRAKISILALPWARQVSSLRDASQQPFRDDTVAGAGGDVGAAIGGEGVAARDMRDGVPNGDAEEAGEGHRDGDGDDLAELLREWCRDGRIGEHRPVTQSSSFSGEKDGDGERSG
ncbi:hypothetical protein RF55_5431 [Lasius niger]|uniref:Uncharacterized protein n=1 Tax=Lasius niger TaxID=67767 RepID=A0A0J7KVT7_LASNI|nr:hypothetical protein RF55_5431 [Lasius niger]